MKKLLFITDNFPFGNNTGMFIQPELPALVERFEMIIATVNCRDAQTEPVPSGVKILRIDMTRPQDKITGRLRARTSPMYYRERRRVRGMGERVKERLSWCSSYFSCAETFARALRKQLGKLDWQPDIIYSYWHMTPLLGVLMHKNWFGSPRVVARAHGRDLYSFRNPLGYQAFKQEADIMLDRMFLACKDGVDYYDKHFSVSTPKKSELAVLGSDNAFGEAPWHRQPNTIRLVSCSNMVELKRIGLIIDSLAMIENVNIGWTHLGGGPLEEKLREQAENKLGGKENVKYSMPGRVPNSEVKKHLSENEYDFFITLTETEGGVPVSIVEACSFGIPVIATNVGGVPDIVGEDNGFLLDGGISAKEIAELINKAAKMTDSELASMRQAAKEKWKNGFVAKDNAEKFADRLLELCGE